jgi:TolB-like protein/DNA-binding winged helix-turn-helix (wHTH) protein/Flp pilus assembly protein TadD
MPRLHFRFDSFELDPENWELRRSGRYVKLERIPMQLLLLLLENPGKLVRREVIIERLWGGNVFVEAEHSINTAVNKLRALLRDDSRNPRFIRTLVGQGYCFIAEVNTFQPAQISTEAADVEDGLHEIPAITDNAHLTGQSQTEEPPAFTEDVQGVQTEPSSQTPKQSFNSKGWVIGSLIGFAAALIIVAVVYWRRAENVAHGALETGELHSIAVLPFRNLAQTTNQDYLVDGMTDQLTTDLARSTPLRVISQRSAMQYKDIQKPIQEIAQALNVDAIVEGSYLREGGQVRITAQLLDARNDRHLWAQTYDESNKDLLAIQDQVTNDIAQQVAITLGSSFKRSRYEAVNSRARESYLRGRYFWNQRTQASTASSVKFYTDAIRQDPNYADAYAALAEAYIVQAMYGDPDPTDSLWKAQYAAERALDLDNTLGEAHTALGAVRVERDWDWAGAEKEYKRALQLSPTDPTAHHWYSLHLSRMGRHKEAEAEIQRALALDPLSLIINTDAAETAFWARDTQKALARVDSILALNPDFAEAHMTKGKILEQLHQYQDAKMEYETGKKLGAPGYVDVLLAHAMALAGEKEDALKLIKRLESTWPGNHLSGADIAIVYCGLRDSDSAMKWFDLAYQQHKRGMGMIGVDPVYDGCRADPRFVSLLNKLQLSH